LLYCNPITLGFGFSNIFKELIQGGFFKKKIDMELTTQGSFFDPFFDFCENCEYGSKLIP
jgi:hypothetical protein